MARKTQGFDCVPWWLNDWLGSSARADLSSVARMGYCELCWRQFSYGAEVTKEEWRAKREANGEAQGEAQVLSKGLANGEARLALLANMTQAEWDEHGASILQYFELINGRYYNLKVEKVIDYRLARMFAGRSGGSKRGSPG